MVSWCAKHGAFPLSRVACCLRLVFTDNLVRPNFSSPESHVSQKSVKTLKLSMQVLDPLGLKTESHTAEVLGLHNSKLLSLTCVSKVP